MDHAGEQGGVWGGLSELVPVGLFRCDAEGRCIAANRRWCELSGLDVRDALGFGWVRALHPDDLSAVMQLSTVDEDGRGQRDLIHRFCRPDGTHRWVQSTMTAVERHDDVPAGVLVSVSDVSDLVASRQALAEREELLGTLLRHSPDVVLRLDLAMRVTYASPAIEHVAGWAPKDVMGRSALDFVADPDARRVARGLAERREGRGGATTVERRFLRRDGTVFWAEASTTVELDQETGAARCYVVVLRDVTDRRAAIEYTHRLRAIVRALPSAVYQADRHGRVESLSDVWSTLTGRSVEESLGFGWLQLVVAADRERVLDAMAGAHAGSPADVDCRWVGPDGDVRWLRIVGSPFVSPEGEVVGTVGYIADVTDRVAEQRRAAVLGRALDASPDIVVVTRVDDCAVQFVNDAARVDLGLQPMAEGGRHTFRELLDEASLARLEAEGLPAVLAGSSWYGDLDLRPGVARVEHLLATLTAAGDDEQGRPLLSLVARDVSDQRAAQRHLTHLAEHDTLTGLGNRAALNERLEWAVTRCRAGGGAVTLMFCDLDGFKEVNDEFGHDAGDAVLIEVAARLRSLVRTTDEPCRIGGDEFVILAEGLRPETGLLLAQRIEEAMAEPITCAAGVVRVGISIGVAGAEGATADATALLAAADTAMYRAKRQGGGGVQVAVALDFPPAAVGPG